MPALTRRYVVMSLATDAPFDPADPDGAFVLKPWKDPAALRALRTYGENCFPELRRDLEAWIRVIEAGPTVRGDVGRRNEAHLTGKTKAKAERRTVSKSAPRAPERKRRTPAKPVRRAPKKRRR